MTVKQLAIELRQTWDKKIKRNVENAVMTDPMYLTIMTQGKQMLMCKCGELRMNSG